MHDCRAFCLDVSDYLDGAVEAARRAEMDAHLICCLRCRLVCQTLRRTLQLCRVVPPSAIPSDVESRLMAELERRFGCKPDRSPPYRK
jgi:anti-sigma factor RsiW